MKSRFILSILSLLFATLVMTAVFFSWMTISNSGKVEESEVGVIDGELTEIESSISTGSGTVLESIEISLLPSQTSNYTLTLTNTVVTDITCSVGFTGITVEELLNTYTEDIYLAGPYIDVNTLDKVSTYINNESRVVAIDETYFRNFIAPATKAIKYGYGISENSITYQGYLNDFNEEENSYLVTVPANSQVVVWLSFYFDEGVYETYNGVEMRNSNSYIEQVVTASISIKK